jgi:hypothetical protein
MTAVLRSELYRVLTTRSSWVTLALATAAAAMFGFLGPDSWALMAGLGAFAVAAIVTTSNYQHGTVVLLYLGQPRRLRALAAQALVGVVLATGTAALSGLFALGVATDRYAATMVVVPLMALFGVANAVLIRHPTWLLAGWGGWVVFVEGVISRFEQPLPFTAYERAGAGEPRYVAIFALWTLAALVLAVVAVRRDVAAD